MTCYCLHTCQRARTGHNWCSYRHCFEHFVLYSHRVREWTDTDLGLSNIRTKVRHITGDRDPRIASQAPYCRRRGAACNNQPYLWTSLPDQRHNMLYQMQHSRHVSMKAHLAGENQCLRLTCTILTVKICLIDTMCQNCNFRVSCLFHITLA